MPQTSNHATVESLNRASEGKLPGHVGLEVVKVEPGLVQGRLTVRPDLVAHTGYLLAGTVLTEGASGFTTAEVKCNFTGTLREGVGLCTARLLHGGRLTQVWDASFTDEAGERLLAAFRCTQIILYPRG